VVSGLIFAGLGLLTHPGRGEEPVFPLGLPHQAATQTPWWGHSRWGQARWGGTFRPWDCAST